MIATRYLYKIMIACYCIFDSPLMLFYVACQPFCLPDIETSSITRLAFKSTTVVPRSDWADLIRDCQGWCTLVTISHGARIIRIQQFELQIMQWDVFALISGIQVCHTLLGFFTFVVYYVVSKYWNLYTLDTLFDGSVVQYISLYIYIIIYIYIYMYCTYIC